MLGFDPTAVGSLRPNPSMTGASAEDKYIPWLLIEFDLLEWWISKRADLIIPIPVNPQDSIFLNAEKEVLEWWHTYRNIL